MLLIEKINSFFSKYLLRTKIVFFVLLILFIFKFSNHREPYPTGDGPEYVLMTEALLNHASADIRIDDSKTFKHESSLTKPWNEIPKYTFFDDIENFLLVKNSYPFLGNFYGSFYVAKNKNVYTHHFYFYSLLNVPMRYVMQITNMRPMLGFKITNIVLILLTSALLLLYNKESLWNSIVITSLFFFNAVFWYINWIHPEALTVCLASASIFLFFNKKYYLSIFLMSLASLQNQPLCILVLMIVVHTLLINKFSIRSFITSALSSVIVLWPSIFYYSNFNITNLVNYGGYISTDYITIDKFIGFFYDLNQGAILAIPIIMIVYPFIIGFFIVKSTQKKQIEKTLFIPFAIIIIVLIVCTMGNWVHGMAVINRYAVWISAIISLHFFYLFSKIQLPKNIKIPAIILILVSQVYTTIYFEKDNLFDWMSNVHKAPAEWVLNNFPSLYNPEPCIFIIRTTHKYPDMNNPNISPIYYLNPNGEIAKMAVHQERLNNLQDFKISRERILEIKENNRFLSNWTYLNEEDFRIYNQTDGWKIKKKLQDSLIQQKIEYIKSDSNWIQEERKKALNNDMPLDSVLIMDAKYVLNIK